MGFLSRVPVVGVRRRRRSHRRVMHRAMAAFMVVVLSFVLVTPARAQFDWANPASWAVVAEMTKVISTMVSIKRQVENVRNLARSEALGAFAPLVDGLRPVGESMERVRGVVNDASRLRVRPGFGIQPADLEPLESIPFNQVVEECDGTPGELCMPALDEVFDDTASGVAAMQQEAVINSAPSFLPTSFTGTRLQEITQVHREETEARIQAARLAAEQQDVFTGELQAHVESMMGMVEEFFGCIEQDTAPDPPRPYCVSNDGLGMGDALEGGYTGTAGLADDLQAKLDTIQRQPDGNASQTQLQVIQTRASMYRARAVAMAAQVRAFELEQESQARLLQEARQRRRYELFNANLRCQEQVGSPYARFTPRADTLQITDDNADVDVFAAGTCEAPPTP